MSKSSLYLSGSRNSDSDYSDGEEDFYYSEIEVNMDSLTEGLSNLTPTSPTTAGPPPVFPLLLTDVPHSEHIAMNGLQSHAPTLLSQSAPSTLCHIRTDHAYQVIHAHTTSAVLTDARCSTAADKWCSAVKDKALSRRRVSKADHFTLFFM